MCVLSLKALKNKGRIERFQEDKLVFAMALYFSLYTFFLCSSNEIINWLFYIFFIFANRYKNRWLHCDRDGQHFQIDWIFFLYILTFMHRRSTIAYVNNVNNNSYSTIEFYGVPICQNSCVFIFFNLKNAQ